MLPSVFGLPSSGERTAAHRISPSSPHSHDFTTSIPLSSSLSPLSTTPDENGDDDEETRSNFFKSRASVSHSPSTADATGPYERVDGGDSAR